MQSSVKALKEDRVTRHPFLALNEAHWQLGYSEEVQHRLGYCDTLVQCIVTQPFHVVFCSPLI